MSHTDTLVHQRGTELHTLAGLGKELTGEAPLELGGRWAELQWEGLGGAAARGERCVNRDAEKEETSI